MNECWTVDVVQRPPFKELRIKFEEILSNEVADYYTLLDQPYQQFNLDNARLLSHEENDGSVSLD